MGAPLERFPDQTGFFISLNVFEPIQNFPHDLQVLRALADGAPALKARDGAHPAIGEHLFGQELAGYQLFKDAGCIACHNGSSVGGNSFQKMGIVEPYKGNTTDGRSAVTGKDADRFYFCVPCKRGGLPFDVAKGCDLKNLGLLEVPVVCVDDAVRF